MDIILIPGLWLDGNAWADVLPGLRAAGHHPITVSPPPPDGDRTPTLDDHLEAVVAAIDSFDDPVLVVGHSAAATIAWLAADRRPDMVARVAMLGGMPAAEGDAYADFFPGTADAVHFPGWTAFEEADVGDLDDRARARMLMHARAVPATVTKSPVHYESDRRKAVPVVMICPEYSVEDAKAWFDGGDIPELIGVADLSYVDIDSGHWPMYSRPDELARVIAQVADGDG